MVANLDEVKQAKALLEEAHQTLEKEGITHKWPIETGIMIEIPAAAILSADLAKYVDFFSIGTNDLTQYTLAAERGNPELSHLNDAMHPAVLKLIDQVTKAAHTNGKWVGVCGELAGDPLAVPILIGLGVDELSMNPGSIPRTKAVLKSISLDDSKKLAQAALETESSKSARKVAKSFLEGRILLNANKKLYIFLLIPEFKHTMGEFVQLSIYPAVYCIKFELIIFLSLTCINSC